MATVILTACTFALAIAAIGSGELSLIAHNLTVATENPAVLNCTLAGYRPSEAGASSVYVQKAIGTYSAANVSEVGSSTLLYLESAQYSDNGQYICTATLTKANSSEVKTISTSFYVNIQGYEAPQKQGFGLFGLVRTSEKSLISCPVVGVPGPVLFYWERGEDLFNMTRWLPPPLQNYALNYERVTMATNVSSGPFVNKQGQLDLSRAREEDSMFYLCTGQDVAGATASQLFRVEVVIQEVFVLWVQWYMILVYCIVGVIIVIFLVFTVWYICANRQECYIKVKKRVTVKKRVNRQEFIAQTTQLPKGALDVDNTFFEMYRSEHKK